MKNRWGREFQNKTLNALKRFFLNGRRTWKYQALQGFLQLISLVGLVVAVFANQ